MNDAPRGSCSSGSRPSREPPAGMPVEPVVLYTRQGCHLCDSARELLVRHGLIPVAIDIDGDASLRARYNECVPVVFIDGRERFRGRIDETLLRRLLQDRRSGNRRCFNHSETLRPLPQGERREEQSR